MIRLVIGGCRHFTNYTLFQTFVDRYIGAYLDESHPDEEIVILAGEARGTDRLAKRYAKENGWEYEGYPADWDKHGNKAGPIRNRKMIRQGNHGIFFWDLKSPGTKDALTFALDFLGRQAVALIVIPEAE